MNDCENKKLFFWVHLKWILFLLYARLFNKKVMFWGDSLFLKDFLKKYKIKNNAIIGIIDKNRTKTGTYTEGYEIFQPQQINTLPKVDYIIYAVKNNNKKMYQEIKSYLKNNVPKVKLLPNDFKMIEKLDSINNKIKVKQLNSIISDLGQQKNVYLFQYSFYDHQGKDFFSGGAERYMLDLSDLIYKLGYKPILIQAGDGKAALPWVRQMKNLTIIGVNAYGSNYHKIINQLKEPALVIYSGIIDWDSNIRFKNSILISHGITWDVQRVDADIRFLFKIIKIFKTIISVDTNTISWFRSTFSNYIYENKINFEYLPNYVDIEKYKPLKSEKNRLKITFPRRCSVERGFWLFANVVPKLIEKYKDILIEFVGFIHTDEVKSELEGLLKKYPNNIIHRVVEQDSMHEVYQNTDISVIPTIFSEGTSLSCLEAMACGNAVVATNVGGLPNLIINNFNGKLVNPDEVSLFDAIDELIDNEEIRKNLSNNAISVAKAFSKSYWDSSWVKILQKYLG